MTSATAENNLDFAGPDGSGTSSPRLGESTCHILPCNVDYEGMANTHVYFKPVQVEKGVLASSFRGRGLLAMQDEDMDGGESRDGYPLLLSVEEDQIQAKMADPGFYQRPQDEIKQVTQRLESIGDELLMALERWEELATIQEGS